MSIPALNVTPSLQLPPAQGRAAPPEAAVSSVATPTEKISPATLVIERAPRLSFTYTKIDPNTGEELWRWPTRPSDEPGAAAAPVSAIGQLADVTA